MFVAVRWWISRDCFHYTLVRRPNHKLSSRWPLMIVFLILCNGVIRLSRPHLGARVEEFPALTVPSRIANACNLHKSSYSVIPLSPLPCLTSLASKHENKTYPPWGWYITCLKYLHCCYPGLLHGNMGFLMLDEPWGVASSVHVLKCPFSMIRKILDIQGLVHQTEQKDWQSPQPLQGSTSQPVNIPKHTMCS